jgi:hypothetical protein
MNKGSDLAQLGITANQMNQYTVELLRTAMIRKEP